MTEPGVEHCFGCGAAYKPGAAFCALCGRARGADAPAVPQHEGGGLGFVLRFYVAMLAVQAVALIYVQITENVFTAMVITTAALGLVTIVAAIPHRALVLPAYRTAGFSALGYLFILLFAPVVLVLVLGYVHGLSDLFGLTLPREMAEFDGRGIGLAVLLVAIIPPLEEELSFRGLIYGGLRRTLTVGETFLISSFAFALLHLSVPALLTHFPLGLYLCWLRHRSGSLWPPTFAHALHNFGVIYVDCRGWG